MKLTTQTNNTIDHIISYVTFEAENKKEVKYTERMNVFYDDIINAAIKYTLSIEAKCYIDITASMGADGITVSLLYRARKQGRIIKSFSQSATWQRGVIIKNKKHVS